MFLVLLYYFYTFNRYYLKPEWKRRQKEYVGFFATAAVVITIKVTIQCLSVCINGIILRYHGWFLDIKENNKGIRCCYVCNHLGDNIFVLVSGFNFSSSLTLYYTLFGFLLFFLIFMLFLFFCFRLFMMAASVEMVGLLYCLFCFVCCFLFLFNFYFTSLACMSSKYYEFCCTVKYQGKLSNTHA